MGTTNRNSAQGALVTGCWVMGAGQHHCLFIWALPSPLGAKADRGSSTQWAMVCSASPMGGGASGTHLSIEMQYPATTARHSAPAALRLITQRFPYALPPGQAPISMQWGAGAESALLSSRLCVASCMVPRAPLTCNGLMSCSEYDDCKRRESIMSGASTFQPLPRVRGGKVASTVQGSASSSAQLQTQAPQLQHPSLNHGMPQLSTLSSPCSPAHTHLSPQGIQIGPDTPFAHHLQLINSTQHPPLHSWIGWKAKGTVRFDQQKAFSSGNCEV